MSSKCSRCGKQCTKGEGLVIDVAPLQRAVDLLGPVANAGFLELCGLCTAFFAKWWEKEVAVCP